MTKVRLKIKTLIFVYIFIFVFTDHFPVTAEKINAISNISQAEESIEVAYLSILEAERMGGDVSELVMRLNNIFDDLSKAERALESEHYDEAVHWINNVLEITSEINVDAINLTNIVRTSKRIALRNQMILSFGSVFLIVLSGYFGWVRFKEYYIQRILNMEPEVVSDES